MRKIKISEVVDLLLSGKQSQADQMIREWMDITAASIGQAPASAGSHDKSTLDETKLNEADDDMVWGMAQGLIDEATDDHGIVVDNSDGDDVFLLGYIKLDDINRHGVADLRDLPEFNDDVLAAAFGKIEQMVQQKHPGVTDEFHIESEVYSGSKGTFATVGYMCDIEVYDPDGVGDDLDESTHSDLSK